MIDRIAELVTRRSRLVIGVWLLAVIALGWIGSDLEGKAAIRSPYIDGTQSKRAHEISLRAFGSDNAVIVMLRGPERAVESQGRTLASRLGGLPRTRVVSPWARGAAIPGLHPSPGVAALLVRIGGSDPEDVAGLLPPVEAQLDAVVGDPVHASIAGLPVVIESARSASKQALKIGEVVAIPTLLVVLLFVFRSVLAALMPLIVGGAVVQASRGVLSLLFGLVEVDLFALALVGMMGLALGVDYSLLVVARFREEQEKAGAAEAARATLRATARSVVPAGSGLILAMIAAALMLPSSIGVSSAIAVTTTAVLSMVSAICVVPALLTSLGDNLDRWSLPRREASRIVALRWSRRLAARPRVVVGIVLALLVCSAWALTLKSGTGSVALLPKDDPGRLQQEEVERTLGPGWSAPMEVVVGGDGSPVTSPERLKALAAFQRRVERDPGVESMAGLSRVASGAERLEGIEGTLAEQQRGLNRLDGGISRLHRGAALNGKGLLAAAQGAGALSSGLGAADEGAGALSAALQKTSAGSSQLSRGLGQADEGSGRLVTGTSKASAGAGKIAAALQRAEEQTGELTDTARLFKNAMHSGEERLDETHGPLQGAEAQLTEARRALQRMTAGQADPEYAAALRAVEEASLQLTGEDPASGERPDPANEGVGKGIERAEGEFGVGLYLAARLDRSGRQASSGMEKLVRASERLDRGLRKLATGTRQVSDGIAALARGGEALSPAMAKVSEGAERLAGGLTQLENGSGRLTSGLGTGAEKSKLLTSGLGRIGRGLDGQQASGGSAGQLADLQRRSPGLFRSSYFILAGLDGSRPQQRSQLGYLVDLDHGGLVARMLIVPKDEQTTAAAAETKERIESDGAMLARKTGTEVVLGGVAPIEIDANDAVRSLAPLVRLALSLVSFLVLVPVLRSLAIPLIAALLNLLTVSASFGLLAVFFNSSLLGGPGYVDTVVITATVMVMFGLAIDYEVFVFARIREEYLRTGSTAAAVRGGLDRTAHVVTGAATIMIAVFLAFSVSELMSIRNFGVAQAIAIAIDAFIVRLVIVPAVMIRLGERCWWVPRWLGRVLPERSTASR